MGEPSLMNEEMIMHRKEDIKITTNAKGTIPIVLLLIIFFVGSFNEFLKVKYIEGGNYEE